MSADDKHLSRKERLALENKRDLIVRLQKTREAIELLAKAREVLTLLERQHGKDHGRVVDVLLTGLREREEFYVDTLRIHYDT